MYGLTVNQIAEICHAEFCGYGDGADRQPKRIVIDSREVQPGDLFAAFRGSNADGNSYISAAFQNGAYCCLTDVPPKEMYDGIVLLVDDVQKAVISIAGEFRKNVNIPIVGITGSVGKTTAKEMVSSVLEQHYSVLKTEKNLNNQLGVPMTLSRIEPGHEIAVVEMGISKPGDMELLGKLVRPSVAVFTSIGNAHLEFLHDLDGVFHEKTRMLDYMSKDGVIIVNGDDQHLCKLINERRIIKCGIGCCNEYKAEQIDYSEEGRTSFLISADSEKIYASTGYFGKHIVSAALLAAAVGREFDLDNSEITKGIAAFRNAGRRGELTRTELLVLFDNCYNANPDSVRSSIESLMLLQGRHVCILGDMLELGCNAEQLHAEIGKFVRNVGVEVLITCGPLSVATADSYGHGAVHYDDLETLVEDIPALLTNGDCVLVQASRGMHFEKVSDRIRSI